MTPINLLDALGTVRRHFLRLVLWTLLAGAAGYVVSMLIPSSYRAASVILPPDEDDLSASLSSSRRSLAALGGLGRFSTYFTQADVAIAILRSRSVFAKMVKEFDLERVYHVQGEERAVRALRDRTEIRVGSDGTITVSVLDHDPQRAADVANGFMAELDRYNREIRSFRGRRTRQFLERRVTESDSTLHALETRLAAYQKVHGEIVLSPDARGGLDAASGVMAEKLSAEVQLELAREYANPNSQEVQQLEARVRELRRQIGNLPGTQVGGAALVRGIAVQQQVFAALTAQLEDARVREAMDTPTIQVLDRAEPPQIRAWPRRSWIAAFGAVLGFGLALAQVSGAIDRFRRAG